MTPAPSSEGRGSQTSGYNPLLTTIFAAQPFSHQEQEVAPIV
ncbi:MAG: hypothetical protein Q7U88_09165 [Desulfocapsaceae bacterium]|nr:hypothetical protein [Desulfocapsaceae bacterium]